MVKTTLPEDATKGSTDRLVELVHTHRSALSRFFNRHAHNRADVPDLVQDVFLRLSRAIVPEMLANPRHYALRVDRSVLVDHYRRGQVRRVGDHTPLANLDLESTDLPLDRVIDSKALVERMNAALAELPERTRDVFALRTLKEMKMAEVARTMRISLSTAEKHHARALAHLTRRLVDFR